MPTCIRAPVTTASAARYPPPEQDGDDIVAIRLPEILFGLRRWRFRVVARSRRFVFLDRRLRGHARILLLAGRMCSIARG